MQVAQGAPALRHAGRRDLPRRRPCAAISARTGAEPCGQSATSASTRPRSIDATDAGPEGAVGRPPPGRPLRHAAGIVDHLLGKTKDVQPWETGLSTWGIGQDVAPTGWRDLIDQLLFEGLLREDPNDGRPLVGLGDAEARARRLSRRASRRGPPHAAGHRHWPRLEPAPRPQRPQRRRGGPRRRRPRPLRDPARLAPRPRRGTARPALRHLPGQDPAGDRPARARVRSTPSPPSPASARPRSTATARACWPP